MQGIFNIACMESIHMPSLLLHTRVCAVATLHNVNAFILVKSQNIFNILRFTEIVPFNLLNTPTQCKGRISSVHSNTWLFV